MQRDIHKGGRPPVVRPAGFYEALLREYDTMTTRQMADAHRVSRATITRWLSIARRKQNEGGAQ